jgi:outer membrane protein OmpA-like peptidoglycan-associated protein
MKMQLLAAVVLISLQFSAAAQTPVAQPASAPIYRLTVESRSLTAINYEHRSAPTKIDFRGTVLLPYGRGEATVEGKRGRTEIDAKFDHLEAPARFGAQYLTYVLWAITPEGRAVNLGEIVPGASDKAHIRVTADLQVFGLIVTAEPYFSVTQPGDVVVVENAVRPDTIGKVEVVSAKYELMSRGNYVYNVPAPGTITGSPNAPKLPMDQYEALVQLYQAQNAVQIAKSLDADHYAHETFEKATRQLREAQALQVSKRDSKAVITAARAAAQTAEDARAIAIKRREADPQAPAQPGTATAAPSTRSQLLQQLSPLLDTRESSGGLLITIADSQFQGLATLDPAAESKLGQVAAILQAYPGLRIEVDGHTDNEGTDPFTQQLSELRARSVSNSLSRSGVPAGSIVVQAFGKTRPLISNDTAEGRTHNRRVEVVISGDSIATMASAR